MKNRDDALLRKIIEYCDEADSAIAMFGDDIEIFSNNVIYRNACCMPVLQIGELCKLVSDELQNDNNQVDWRGWCGIRDIFAHQYTNLDYKKTWTVLRADLPKMKNHCKAILKAIDDMNLVRINEIIMSNNISDANAQIVYDKIIANTGVSLNAFSDEQLKDFILSMKE